MALVVALLAVSSSPPLIAFAVAPGLAIAFWRNALAVGVLIPATLVGRRTELAALTPRTILTAAAAGAALAVHFGAWIPSVKLTSVATATGLVATQPVWQGLIALRQGRRPHAATWVGIGTAVIGAVLVTGADLTVSTEAVVGDLLALAGGVAGAVYFALGERVRTSTSTTTYTTICYTVCAALLGAVCLVFGVPVVGFDARTWLAIVALAAGAQLLGHSMFSYALRSVPATTVSMLGLLEVPAAALIAWAWLSQVPRAAVLPGLALLMVGVLVYLTSPTASSLAAHSRAASAGSEALDKGRRGRRSTK